MVERDVLHRGVHKIGKEGEKYIYEFSAYFERAINVELWGAFTDPQTVPMKMCKNGEWKLKYESDITLEGMRYKYKVVYRDSVQYVCDPYAKYAEFEENGASIVFESSFEWRAEYKRENKIDIPINILNFDINSRSDHENYRDIGVVLSEYASSLHYTHIKLSPISERVFAPTSRFGNPDDMRFLIDILHARGIGVIIELPYLERKEFYATAIFFWLREYRIDGVYVGDITSVLQNDKSAAEFFQKLNEKIHLSFDGVLMIAKECSAWPLVTSPDGLGFDLKLNDGWARDILDYAMTVPENRAKKRDELTFSLRYAFGARYILPAPENEPSELEAFLTYFMAHPGKKLCPRYNGERIKEHLKKLNEIYKAHNALWKNDNSPEGFAWIRESDDPMIFRRIGDADELVCIFNFSGTDYKNLRVSIGEGYKYYRDILFSDGIFECKNGDIYIDLAPLEAMILAPEK